VSIRAKITSIAQDYFSYMARNFPVMCSSDEFPAFPRAEESLSYLNRLDSLDSRKIAQAVSHAGKLLSRLNAIKIIKPILDAEIDKRLLRQSLSAFIRNFDKARPWQHDPSIYIKIYLLGIDQIISKLQLSKGNSLEFILERIKKGPHLFKEARANLKDIPKLHNETALHLIKGAYDYFKNTFPALLNYAMRDMPHSDIARTAMAPLKGFEEFLKGHPCQKDFITDRRILEDLIRTDYSYDKRNLEEIFTIAKTEYADTIARMANITTSTSKAWDIADRDTILRLYTSQIYKLRDFVRDKEIITLPKTKEVTVTRTPAYLAPIRQTASYASPLSQTHKEQAYFYVTPHINRIHNEYIFVTAHETYPGHHLLDSKRRQLKDVIRRSVESALFYEGWASYAERLVDEFGFITDPGQRLIGLRRQAWRAVRSMLDVGLRIKRMTLEDAARKLVGLGYSKKIVKSMVSNYALTCGYQLCYTLGKYEFDELRKKFMPKFGMKRFHDLVLASGEIPFDLLERKLKSYEQK